MKVTGIVAEYNPFHNGHLYHLSKAREETNADYIVVVLSGDFVQRGSPAIIDKYSRTQTALMAGADLVLELPVYYATSSTPRTYSGAGMPTSHTIRTLSSSLTLASPRRVSGDPTTSIP